MRKIVSNRNIILSALLIHYCNSTPLGNDGMYSNDTSSSIEALPSSSAFTSSILSEVEIESSSKPIYLISESSIFTSTPDVQTSTSISSGDLTSSIISSDKTSQIQISTESSTSIPTSSSVDTPSSSSAETESPVSSSLSIIPSSSAWVPSYNSTTSSESSPADTTNAIDQVNTPSNNGATTVTETTTQNPAQTVTDTQSLNPNTDGETINNSIDTNYQSSNINTAPQQTDTVYYSNINGNTVINTADVTDINTAIQDTAVDPYEPTETATPVNTQIQTEIPTTTNPADYNPYHPNRPDNLDNDDANTGTDVPYTIHPETATTNIGTQGEITQNTQIPTTVADTTANNVLETGVLNTNEKTHNTVTEATGAPTTTDTAVLGNTQPAISQNQEVTTGTKLNHDALLSDTKTIGTIKSHNELGQTVSTDTKEDATVSNRMVSAATGYNTLNTRKETGTLTNEKGVTTTNVGTQNPTDQLVSQTKHLYSTGNNQKLETDAATQKVGSNTIDQHIMSNTINKDTTKTRQDQMVINTNANTVSTANLYSKYPQLSVTQTKNGAESTGKAGLHLLSSNTNYLVSGKKTANAVTTNVQGTVATTTKSNVGVSATQKPKGSTKAKATVSYTLSADNDWLPSSIIVQTTYTKKSESTINPSSFPTSLPAAIAASNEVLQSSNTTLIAIGFGQELNYNFLVENPLSSAQIFNFLPEALMYPFYVDEVSSKDDIDDDDLSYESIYVSMTVSDGTTTISPTGTLVKRAGTMIEDSRTLSQIFNESSAIINTISTVKNRYVEQTATTIIDESSASVTSSVSSSSVSASATIDSSLIKVKQISPYIDPDKDYVISVAEVYFPSDFVDTLKNHLQDKDSVIFDNPVPSLKSLMSLTDPSINLLGLVDSSNSDSSSSTNTENSQENQQQINQAFKSSIKNGTQYGSLDVTGMKKSKLSKAIRNRLIIYLTCMVLGIFMWVLSFLTLFRYIKRKLSPQKSISLNAPRRSFLNITKIGLYGDDIGSLWSGDSSNYSDSINEKIKHLVNNKKARQKRFTLFSSNTNDLSLCYSNFIENANGDTLITNDNINTNNFNFGDTLISNDNNNTNTFNFGHNSPITHSFGDFNHQTISTYNTSSDSFDFDVVNAHNNPFSDNYRISPQSKTIDLFSDDIDQNFDMANTTEAEEEEASIADVEIGDLDELDEELYKNLIGTIKGRDPNDPLAIETRKLMTQIDKKYHRKP